MQGVVPDCPLYFFQVIMKHTENDLYQLLSDTYRLLAAAFYPPDRRFFLEENLCSNLERVFNELCPEAVPHCQAMAHALQNSTTEELQVEHAALFIGPFELLAPPYGSVYLEGKHAIMGDSTVEVQRLYRQAGLLLKEKEVPDHIALELEFAGYLAGKVHGRQHDNDRDAMEETRKFYKQFVHGTLIRWIPEFCRRIRSETEHTLYNSLASCLEEFVIKENRVIQCDPV